MPWRSCRLLSLAPYRVLPATTGGHWGIVHMHDALGRFCQDHVLGTTDNGSSDGFAFELHRIFPPSPFRYRPGFGLQPALGIAHRFDATHIFCDHPYMAPLAIRLSRRLKIPWALRCHNIEADRFQGLGKWWWPALRMFEGYALRHADAIFFITPEDRERAKKLYRLPDTKCHLAPFGTPLKEAPQLRPELKRKLAKSLGLNADIPWLYFLGVHSYAPNAEAVQNILRELLPRLQAAAFSCEILIAGKGLPEVLKREIEATQTAVRALGFVEDLNEFLLACDMMLNPMLSGGGIKTKAVEALAYSKMLVSTQNGAAGLLPSVCGQNLIILPDGDWDAFAAAIPEAARQRTEVPQAFFDCYNWDAISRQVLQKLSIL
ncbi:MAG: glycosyltransferase family 4 protein [Bacteroidetes bacterium]|nr:glycosyltransferase family 4 protein [Bacteroidota bacterium]